MRARAISAVLTALTAVSLPAAGRAALVENFKVETWEGAAFTSDKTGAFTHCSVFADYGNSTLYISSQVDGSWYLSAANVQWSLAAGETFPVQFRIDENPPISGTSGAVGPQQIGLPIPPGHPFIDLLRRGKRLTLVFQGGAYSFDLKNSGKAIAAARECVARHLELGTQSPVVATAGAASPPVVSAPVDHTRPSVATGERLSFGPWVVTATVDSAGAFANCTAFGVYGDDQLILSYFPDGVWTFGLYRAAWHLDTNETYFLWYNIDAPADAPNTIKRPVDAAEPKRIFFEVSEVEDIIQRMERGTTLNMQVRGITTPPEAYNIPLTQTAQAFGATRQCVQQQQPQQQAAPAQAEAPQAETPQTQQAEAPQTEAPQVEPPQAEQSAAPQASPPSGSTPSESALPSLGSKTLEPLSVPGWEAAAFARADGAFTHCAIKAEYQNGATLGLARVASGDLVLQITHKDWALEVGERLPLSYSFSGSSAAATEGEVAAPNLIVARMAGDPTATAALRAAKQMSIETAGKSLSFDISDIGPGVEAIDACAVEHAALQRKSGATHAMSALVSEAA